MIKDKKSPLVSIIIPTFNYAQYLSRALESVLKQTYQNFEVIIIDNHSIDNTDEIVTHYSDTRITYLKVQNKGVIAVSRNAGIKKSKGEWVAFLDSDDYWTVDKLQTCINSMTDNIDLIYHDLVLVGTFGIFRKRTMNARQLYSPIISDLLVNGNPLATSSVVVRRSILNRIGGMNESTNMVAAEDFNTWLRVATISERFKYLPKKLGFYQIHSLSTHSNRDMSISLFHGSSDFLKLLSDNQRKKFEARVRYTKGKFNYLAKNYSRAKPDMVFACLHGQRALKIKALFILINISIYQYSIQLKKIF
jgi:glycosyltransferase involved in cell wall biosynthesis